MYNVFIKQLITLVKFVDVGLGSISMDMEEIRGAGAADEQNGVSFFRISSRMGYHFRVKMQKLVDSRVNPKKNKTLSLKKVV